ncbi:Protein of unknown function [Bacillus cereus]|nr:Protein of unknown function [Bacillus cereus]
MGKEALTED